MRLGSKIGAIGFSGWFQALPGQAKPRRVQRARAQIQPHARHTPFPPALAGRRPIKKKKARRPAAQAVKQFEDRLLSLSNALAPVVEMGGL
jgi:hypothetical protein